MTHLNHRIHLRRERGQTLVIAMLVLGVLLVLGLVFISLIGRNVKSTDRLGQRSVANDLAEAGIRYAHEQLYRGQLGADWRGTPTSLYAATDTAHTNPFTRDPDALYLRGPARDGGGNPLAFVVGSNQPDLGGPDGLGPFIRVSFNNGRALLRVRYAPSDANMFSASIEGSLRNPKAVRSYLIIESVGRPGRLDPNDPTLLLTPTPVQFDQFASTAALRQAVNTWQANETKISTSRPLRAFASIGLIDTARFISNKYNVSSPARLGIAPELGVTYSGVAVGSRLGLQVGTSLNVPAFRQTLTPSATLIPGFGSMQVNGDLRLYGRMDVALNRALGDVLSVSGTISGENGSTLNLTSQDIDNSGNWQAAQLTALTPAGNPSFDSRSNTFSTFHGVLRDGVASADTEGFPRGNGRKVPPSILTTDADTGASRYVLQTRESGVLVAGGNSGRFGYGQGAYIDNISDLQIPSTESGRQAVGAQQSLIEEWLNPIPKRTADRSFWVGPYYIPPGAFVQLLPDGFIITRNGAAPAGERTWKLPNGADSGSTSIRYRIGLAGGQRYIINSLTSADIQSASPNFANGMPFNGVIYAEGNIRIRGVIPTDVQLTVVSRGSIYIEGSIIKGQTANGLQPTEGFALNQVMTRPSKSALMLMAKDYVVLNTTMFFGPSQSSDIEPDANGVSANGFWGAIVHLGSNFSFLFDEANDPNGLGANPLNPATWQSFNTQYVMAGAANKLTTKLLVSHAVAPGAQSPATFFTMNVNFGAFDTPGSVVSSYQFPVGMYPYAGTPNFFNTAANFVYGSGPYPNSMNVYGLGSESWQQYPKFESVGFDLIRPTEVNTTADLIVANGTNGVFDIFKQGSNDLTIRPTSVGGQATNDYVVARTALMPHNIRIEASMFAEEGSFFVIPGAWANPNPNDRRDAYQSAVASYVNGGLSAADAKNSADRDRFQAFGSSPDTVFYAEPLDVKIDIIGSVSENMPPPISAQSEWLKKWGWIPQDLAATGNYIPQSHVPAGRTIPAVLGNPDPNVSTPFVPNLIISYDPMLATGRSTGFYGVDNPATVVRTDDYGRVLPPMPRLPVSPALAFFGDVQ